MSSTFLLLFIAVVNVQSSPTRAFQCSLNSDTPLYRHHTITYTSCNPHTGIRAQTGIFVAPESGTWQFTFTGTVVVTNSGVYSLRLVQRDPEGHETVLAVLSSDSFGDVVTRETTSMTGVVELRRGSHVWVKVQNQSSHSYLTSVDQRSAFFTGIRVGS